MGSITGKVTNGGRINLGQPVAPGQGPAPVGVLTIIGDYVQTATGRLDLRLLRVQNQQYDRVQIQGDATLDGDLVVWAQDGFVPTAGDAYNLMSFASRTGDFRRPYSLPTLPQPRTWQINMANTEFTITIQ